MNIENKFVWNQAWNQQIMKPSMSETNEIMKRSPKPTKYWNQVRLKLTIYWNQKVPLKFELITDSTPDLKQLHPSSKFIFWVDQLKFKWKIKWIRLNCNLQVSFYYTLDSNIL